MLLEINHLEKVYRTRFSKEDIIRFNKVSDGVIVGTKIVRDLHEDRQQEVQDFVAFGANLEK